MGSVVTLLETPSTSELLPRVEESDAAGEASYGIAVGGDTDGVYSTTGLASGDDSTRATSSAGQGVVIVTQGRCLARVNGSATNIAVGDGLGPSANAGILESADAATDYIIARALQPSTGDGDIIAVDVQREGLFT